MIIDASRWEYEPTPWAAHAACAGHDPDLWFPHRGDATSPARALCTACPVSGDCLDYALRWNIDQGIWGGTSARERRTIRAENQPTRPRFLGPPHGTSSCYARGCRCDQCRIASTQQKLTRP